MTANFEVLNGDLKITFFYQGETTKVQSIVEDAAEYLWEHGYGDHGTEEEPIVYDDLTNQQQLNLVDQHVKQIIIDLANTFKSTEAQKIARETEAADEYNL